MDGLLLGLATFEDGGVVRLVGLAGLSPSLSVKVGIGTEFDGVSGVAFGVAFGVVCGVAALSSVSS